MLTELPGGLANGLANLPNSPTDTLLDPSECLPSRLPKASDRLSHIACNLTNRSTGTERLSCCICQSTHSLACCTTRP